MGFLYSEKLIQDTIQVFFDEDGILFSRDEAITALDSLSGLFLAFGEREPRHAPQRARETLSLAENARTISKVSVTDLIHC